MADAATVGILAYGSLVDDPGEELSRVIRVVARGVETPFPVEFARASRTRGGAPTLVPVASGKAVTGAVLVLETSEELAADMLWRRETRQKDFSRRYVAPLREALGRVSVRRLESFAGLDVVLYTSISADISPMTADELAARAIASVATAERGLDGITYLMNALANGIETTLSAAYESAILAQAGAGDLQTALRRTRSA